MLPAGVRRAASGSAASSRKRGAAGLLNHPNIVVVHDVGDHEGLPYLVTELLEGETLRERLRDGAAAARKAVGATPCRWRAASPRRTTRAIVHRDLKPENLFLTPDGVVKILDFGLALQAVVTDDKDTRSPTLTRDTAPGVVLGTVGYMSPEQARGETADHRSDIFSLGAVLYEMLTGRRAFHGDTAVGDAERDPEAGAGGARAGAEGAAGARPRRPPLPREEAGGPLPVGARRGVRARGPRRGQPVRRHRRGARLGAGDGCAVVGGVAAAGAFVALGVFAGRPLWEKPQPTFKQLTFRRGFADYARFAPDGRTVIYGAAWDGQPTELYMTRTDSPESSALGLKYAKVLSISADGRMLVLLDPTRRGAFFGWGTLAEVPLAGGTPREILENATGAEWTPDGEICVARQTTDRVRIELPPGQTLYLSSAATISFLRVSPTWLSRRLPRARTARRRRPPHEGEASARR